MDCHISSKRPPVTFHIPLKSVKKRADQLKPENNKKKRKENAAVPVLMISKSSGDVDGLSPPPALADEGIRLVLWLMAEG